MNKIFDLATVQWDELTPKNRWQNGSRSDSEIERRCHILTKDAVQSQNSHTYQGSKVVQKGLPITRTEPSLNQELTNRIPKCKRYKNSPDGLYKVLAPGFSVVHGDITPVLKEPGMREVSIRNSD